MLTSHLLRLKINPTALGQTLWLANVFEIKKTCEIHIVEKVVQVEIDFKTNIQYKYKIFRPKS